MKSNRVRFIFLGLYLFLENIEVLNNHHQALLISWDMWKQKIHFGSRKWFERRSFLLSLKSSNPSLLSLTRLKNTINKLLYQN